MNESLKSEENQFVRIKMCEKGGCLAKVSGSDLITLVKGACSIAGDSLVIPSAEEPEDASIVEINGMTLLLSTDIGPLIGVDGFIAGQIAALHALSDIYVMGGTPTHALVTMIIARSATNLQAQAVLGGVFDACKNEGVEAVGGHTIKSEEFLVGLSVLGSAAKSGCIPKRNCKVGDVIMISKPIGTGIGTRAVFHGLLGEEALSEAISVMKISNKRASQAALEVGVRALTDVTGFGLLGHLSEMLSNNQGANIFISDVPILESILDLSHVAMRTAFTSENLDYSRRKHKVKLNISNISELALIDPQTNGPVLAAVDPKVVSILESQGFISIGSVNNTGQIVVK